MQYHEEDDDGRFEFRDPERREQTLLIFRKDTMIVMMVTWYDTDQIQIQAVLDGEGKQRERI